MPILEFLAEEVLQLVSIFSIMFGDILIELEWELPHAAYLGIIFWEGHTEESILAIYSLENFILIQLTRVRAQTKHNNHA